jgi:spore photoproduct lyase
VTNFQPNFSHIYLENGTEGYPLTQIALSKFPKAKVIKIEHYKDVFNRTGQDFQIQKSSMKLILAKKKEPYLYPASDMVQEYGTPNTFYNTPILNCLYNCDYCFLQGMYPSGNLVVFVNEDDLFYSITNKLKKLNNPSEPMIVSISYNTDLMAMENIIPMTSRWIKFARKQENLKIEIRTKSALFSSLKNIQPTEKVILSWTLSPDMICEKYESTAPPLHLRLKSLKHALESGWTVRLCFDPVLFVNGWEEIYGRFIDTVFQEIKGEQLLDLTLGVFRMNKDYFKRIKKREIKSDLFYSDYAIESNTVTVPINQRESGLSQLKNQIANHVPLRKILVWG